MNNKVDLKSCYFIRLGYIIKLNWF